jgi:hypothetical protein
MSSGHFSRHAAGRKARALSVLTSILFGALALASSGGAFAQCQGPGAPAAGSPWQCLTAIQVPGNPVTAFDISWVNPVRAEYYLADRSNAAIDVVNTATNTFKAQITSGPGGSFVGAVLNTAAGAAPNTLNNNVSGPDGVTSFGKWLYAGDGNSTLKVIDLNAGQIVQSIPTGGSTRVDEMALTGIMSNGQQWLLAANNAEDPPFATLFLANGNNNNNNIQILARINVDPSVIPPRMGLSLEQPSWDPLNKRFYVSIPQINYPAGCTPFVASNSATGVVGCQGGLLVIDPSGVQAPNCTMIGGIPALGSVCQYTYSSYNPTQNTGVLSLPTCAPNGSAVGPTPDGIGRNLLLGCTPANNPSVNGTVVINTNTLNFATIGNITGSDEVWYNGPNTPFIIGGGGPGDDHYYTGSSANLAQFGGPALGIIDANTNILVSTIPQGGGSHSVAADSIRNTIYVPQVVPFNPSNTAQPGAGSGDKTGVSKQTCGGNNGCIVVYQYVAPPPPPITD